MAPTIPAIFFPLGTTLPSNLSFPRINLAILGCRCASSSSVAAFAGFSNAVVCDSEEEVDEDEEGDDVETSGWLLPGVLIGPGGVGGGDGAALPEAEGGGRDDRCPILEIPRMRSKKQKRKVQ
jgi:hypothetical protein